MFVYGNYRNIILQCLGVGLFTAVYMMEILVKNCVQFGSSSPVFDL